MNNLNDFIKGIKVPGLSREIFYFMSGFLFLLILNYLFKPDLLAFPNILHFGKIGLAMAIIVFSYFLARVCREIGATINSLVFFLLRNEKMMYIKKYKKELHDFINEKQINLGGLGTFHFDELHTFVYKDDGLHLMYERSVQHIILVNIFLGFSFILGIFYSYFVFIITFILIIESLTNQFEMCEKQINLSNYIESQKQKSQVK
jgi:hypothetical protein